MDRAKPQQDVQQLYRIAASVQSQRGAAQIKIWSSKPKM
jgi:hypothetical protein